MVDKGTIWLDIDEIPTECKILYNAEDLDRMVESQVKRIARDYRFDDVVIVPIREGGMMYAQDLLKGLNATGDVNVVGVEPIKVSSYGNERESSGSLVWTDRLPDNMIAKYGGALILLVDDIVDSARTMWGVSTELRRQYYNTDFEVRTVAAFDKPLRRRYELRHFQADYVGIVLEGTPFLGGYGLDINGLYRDMRLVVEVPV